jgi:hypothetical protein
MHNSRISVQLADAIYADLFEPWREFDAVIRTFCCCSLTLSGACSLKRPRARRSRSRSGRRTARGKSADPGGGGPSRSGDSPRTLKSLNGRAQP